MQKSPRTSQSFVAAAAIAAAATLWHNPVVIAADPPASSAVVTAITQPSERHKLTFPAPGLVIDKPVKEGDSVKQGQVLMAQDDFLELKELEKAKVEADSAAKLEAAQADYNAKKHVYERKLDTFKKGGANLQEVEDAELDMILREKQIKVATDDVAEAKIKAAQEAKKVKDMKLVSPVDGIVEKMVLEIGEMADPQKPEAAVWVVKNDPLNIEIRDLSSKQVGHLHNGDKLQVRYADETEWHEAAVTFRAPVVDAASDMQLVKLSLPNPSNRDAGLQIQVQLPADVAAAGESHEKTAAAGN